MLIENEIIQQILHYEKMLQNPKNFSTEDLSQLIDDNFIEIGQSGKTWTKKQIIEYFDNQKSDDNDTHIVVMEDECFLTVDESVVLLTYTFNQTDISSNVSKCSRRSSLWKKQGASWVMVFHQGTPSECMGEEGK